MPSYPPKTIPGQLVEIRHHAKSPARARGHQGNVQGDSCDPVRFSDDSIATRFADACAGEWKYVPAWGKWLLWNGHIWETDTRLRIFSDVRRFLKKESADCDNETDAVRVLSAKTVANIERLTRCDRRLAATPDQFDADIWLLNTPAGIIDLQKGEMRLAASEDCVTKTTAVAPAGGCPLWLGFLATVTKGDVHLTSYLKRVAGYALTGSTQEHAFFVFYGPGGNGKSVMLNTISGISHTYAAVAPIDTFTASNSATHPTDLAGLQGCRQVHSQETEEGRSLAESRIKSVTGGDPVTARFMRQDFFTYQPQFKLFIAGNHKPSLRNVDDAMRRRVHLIPFDVKISAAQRDPELPEKLKAEWPGILSWMIEGCLEWQREGLNPPPAVIGATADYFESEDAVGNWLKECCVISKTQETTSSALFLSWSAWAHAAGEFVGSQKRFSQALLTRGFSKRMNGDGRTVFMGIAGAMPTKPHWSED